VPQECSRHILTELSDFDRSESSRFSSRGKTDQSVSLNVKIGAIKRFI